MCAVATPMSLVLVGLLSNFTKKSMKKMLAVSVDETDDELERVILTCRQFAAAAKVKAQIQSGKIEMNQKDDYRYYFKGHQIAGDFLVLACATPIVDIPRDTIRGFFDKILAKWPQSRGFYKDEDYRDAIREQMLAISGMAEASETEEDSKEADILEEDTEVSESDDGRAEGSQSDLDQVSAAVASPITAQPLAAPSIAARAVSAPHPAAAASPMHSALGYAKDGAASIRSPVIGSPAIGSPAPAPMLRAVTDASAAIRSPGIRQPAPASMVRAVSDVSAAKRVTVEFEGAYVTITLSKVVASIDVDCNGVHFERRHLDLALLQKGGFAAEKSIEECVEGFIVKCLRKKSGSSLRAQMVAVRIHDADVSALQWTDFRQLSLRQCADARQSNARLLIFEEMTRDGIQHSYLLLPCVGVVKRDLSEEGLAARIQRLEAHVCQLQETVALLLKRIPKSH